MNTRPPYITDPLQRGSEPLPIEQISLNELIAYYKGSTLDGLQGECVAIETQPPPTKQEPFRIDAAILGLVLEGEQSVLYNMRRFHLRKGMAFFYTSNAILQIESSRNFRAQLVIVSTEFIRGIHISLPDLMPRMLQFASRPCFELEEREREDLGHLISLIQHEVQPPEQTYSRDAVRSLLSTIIYKMANFLCAYYAVHPDEARAIQGRNEAYFRRFLELLSQHYKSQRSVGFYANELCITSKYLTTIIKRISGSSVSDWVDHYVCIEAKTLLKNSSMSIQEIAYHLHFPNQSFFGSYFKRLTGMSPTQYRNS